MRHCHKFRSQDNHDLYHSPKHQIHTISRADLAVWRVNPRIRFSPCMHVLKTYLSYTTLRVGLKYASSPSSTVLGSFFSSPYNGKIWNMRRHSFLIMDLSVAKRMALSLMSPCFQHWFSQKFILILRLITICSNMWNAQKSVTTWIPIKSLFGMNILINFPFKLML